MTEVNKVKVDWIAFDDGGRAVLPNGLRYIGISRFEDDRNWPDEAWSIVLIFDVPPYSQGLKSYATARFLAPDAPDERLKRFSTFNIYEGCKVVARYTVV